jgi:hypothetical protein
MIKKGVKALYLKKKKNKKEEEGALYNTLI